MLLLLDLPNEVLDITFSNLRQPELYNLCLTCRKTYASARTYLYRDVTIVDRKDFGSTGTLNALRSFICAIWRNPKLADQVTSLTLLDAPDRSSPALSTEADWVLFKPLHNFPRPDVESEMTLCKDLVDLLETELSHNVDVIKSGKYPVEFMKAHLQGNSRCGMLGLILNRLNSNLRTLRLDIDRASAGTAMNPPINLLTGSTADYRNLKDLTVRGHAFHTREGVPIVQGDGWAWMPVLESLTFDHLYIKDLSLMQEDTFAGLEILTVTNCTLDVHLTNLLSPVLRTLAIENCKYSKFELHTRKPADKWPCKHSLESLTILDSDCVISGSFTDFSRLKYLAIDTTAWDQRDLGANPSVQSLLPESIVGLHLGNCFLDEFPPRAATCARVENQMLTLLASRNLGSHPDLEFVEISANGRHDGIRQTSPTRQLKMREKLQKAYLAAGPKVNSQGQVVNVFFTMLCSCVWDCKHLTGVSAEQTLSACWLAQEPTFKRTGIAVPAA